MSTATVVGMYIAPSRGAPTEYVEQVHAVPGSGIEGDRYFQDPGMKPKQAKTGIQITLVESEAIEDMSRDGIQISPGHTRRNIITRGISLNDLVGRDFTVGKVHLRGVRLCEPCDYLASRTDPRLKQSMTHRGGLRADILSEGFIHLNDPITPAAKEQP